MTAASRAASGRERGDFKTEWRPGSVLASAWQPERWASGSRAGRIDMGFSGVRAVMMIVALVVLVVAVTKFDLPGWIIPVGLIVAGVLVRAKEKRA
jgi:hypothetical protein